MKTRITIPILSPSETPKWYQLIRKHTIHKRRKYNLDRAIYALTRISEGDEFYVRAYPDKGEGQSVAVWMDEK